MNRRVWLVPAENRRTSGVDAGARPVKVLRLCSRTRGRKRGAVWRRFGAALFEAMQAGADSEGFEAMRGARSDTGSGLRCLERRWFGTTLFGAALFGVSPVWGGGCNPAGRLFSRNSFLLHNLFLSPIIAANLTGNSFVMAKMSRRKKLVRVAKRKLLKPVLYAAGMSFVLYLAISNVVLQKKVFEDQVPRFLITRISRTFDETEFMHLLLTVQEIMKMPTASAELEEFANGAFPSPCPRFLEQQLKRMNWEPQAFLVRVKKLFDMYDVYDRVARLDETIAFLSTEIDERRLPFEMKTQVDVLQRERDNIIGTQITEEEYNFVNEYRGLILRLKRQ